MYSVEILKSEDGFVVASCRELGLTCVGSSEEEALDELQTLIFFHTAAGLDPRAISPSTPPRKTSGERILFVPPRGSAH